MRINPFDENPCHRKIVSYDEVYGEIFSAIKAQVESSIDTARLFHIGSTAVPGLRGKPMIDIVAVTTRKNLRAEQAQLRKLNFHERDTWTDTDDKPYVCGSVLRNCSTYNINIHICHREDWIHKEGLKLAHALKAREDLCRKYELAKDKAHSLEPTDPEKYNQAKEQVIHEIYQTINSGI